MIFSPILYRKRQRKSRTFGKFGWNFLNSANDGKKKQKGQAILIILGGEESGLLGIGEEPAFHQNGGTIQLMEEIWGIECDTAPDTVTVHIGRLRKRFEHFTEFEIENIRGLGYKAVKRV